MRPKLTWRVARWSEAAWVRERDGLRAEYGDRAAEIVEWFAHLIHDRRDRPSAQDMKLTLRWIAAKPARANLRRVDGYSEAALATVAWRLYRTTNLQELAPTQLADCARQALRLVGRGSGAPETDELATAMVKALLDIHRSAPLPISERDALLRDALLACGLGAGDKTVQRLLTKVGQDC